MQILPLSSRTEVGQNLLNIVLTITLFVNEKGKKMTFSKKQAINEIKGYTYPVLSLGKQNFVYFYAFDPVSGQMKRKKIMLGRVKGQAKIKQTGKDIINRLTEKLISGWNPWMEAQCPLEYTKFHDAVDKYKEYLAKLYKESDLREQTFLSYSSYLNILSKWATEEKHIIYIYQFDRRFVSEFLDYVFIERNNTIQTRNNYLSWIRVFSTYLLQRGYLTADPVCGIKTLARRSKNKNRDVIPDCVMALIRDYLTEENKYYLLACYLCHYVLVRPMEMSWLHIRDIKIKAQTLFIHGEHAKNHNDAVVTLPAHVLQLMIELGIFKYPGEYFLFSDNFRPGPERKSEKTFRDYWTRKVRAVLGFSPRYKFYSLKDTGITNMLKSNKDVLTVRDQARHSSILITNTYTPQNIKEASPLLMNYKGVL